MIIYQIFKQLKKNLIYLERLKVTIVQKVSQALDVLCL